MSDDDIREPRKPSAPELTAENWEVGDTDVVLEEDGMRVIVELRPRVEGETSTKVEVFFKPF